MQKNKRPLYKYLLSCFLLMLPIMIWNILFTEKLPQEYQPEVFWKEIPAWLKYAENISRILLFILTILMPLSISTSIQKRGLMQVPGLASIILILNFRPFSWSWMR